MEFPGELDVDISSLPQDPHSKNPIMAHSKGLVTHSLPRHFLVLLDF